MITDFGTAIEAPCVDMMSMETIDMTSITVNPGGGVFVSMGVVGLSYDCRKRRERLAFVAVLCRINSYDCQHTHQASVK